VQEAHPCCTSAVGKAVRSLGKHQQLPAVEGTVAGILLKGLNTAIFQCAWESRGHFRNRKGSGNRSSAKCVKRPHTLLRRPILCGIENGTDESLHLLQTCCATTCGEEMQGTSQRSGGWHYSGAVLVNAGINFAIFHKLWQLQFFSQLLLACSSCVPVGALCCQCAAIQLCTTTAEQ